jgi:hypothetical protein
VAAKKIAQGKAVFSNEILKLPAVSLAAVRHCCQVAYFSATLLNSSLV